MKKSMQAPLLSLLLVLLLSACVANNEMSQVITQLNASNKQAAQVLVQLSAKDKAITTLLNRRLNENKILMTAQVQQHYFHALARLRASVIVVYGDINRQFAKAKQGCLTQIAAQVQHLTTLVSAAEQDAKTWLAESKKFPNDKTLALQAAQAAAQYFAELNDTNSISDEHSTKCVAQLESAKTQALAKITQVQDSQEAKLTALADSKMQAITTMPVLSVSHSQAHFAALSAWLHENELAYSNTMMYLHTNNILSEKGVLASALQGLGQGAITQVLGKDVAIPSSREIGELGEGLLSSITQESKQAFAASLQAAQQAVNQTKEQLFVGAEQLVQQSVMSVLKAIAQ
ncbi:hypothetical protein SAMN05216262_101621 [Colwellia chukchiensis]|uniref:Lipoprotein n=1 Tax=Colwellia chukchiensis TaxID=641665 RepID=A0A1H7HW63_9GAMM|nr:hypothetical protein [Colwellia chukchiensis]SEK54408.1 hypothetical protein SAMN05216262_101621 [Colwellia chukchiensis]